MSQALMTASGCYRHDKTVCYLGQRPGQRPRGHGGAATPQGDYRAGLRAGGRAERRQSSCGQTMLRHWASSAVGSPALLCSAQVLGALPVSSSLDGDSFKCTYAAASLRLHSQGASAAGLLHPCCHSGAGSASGRWQPRALPHGVREALQVRAQRAWCAPALRALSSNTIVF